MKDQERVRYFLYARKSSEADDRQVLSIESQIDELKAIASERNLNVVSIFTESMSALQPGRPTFNLMMQKIQSGEANGIICWKIDRLARNMVDGGIIMHCLQNSTIKHIVTNDREYKSDDIVMMAAFEFSMANQYSIDLSSNVKRGIRKKIEKGQLPGVAPLGYMNQKDRESGENKIVPDPDRFQMIRMLFNEFLKGNHTIRTLQELAQQRGFRSPQKRKVGGNFMALSTVHKMLTNPFYCGLLRFNGEIYNASHTPMITMEEFDRVQLILGRKGKPRPQKHKFPFTGIMECGECGCSITAEIKRKVLKSGEVKLYTYYHCTKRLNPNCTQGCVDSAELEKQIETYLESITIPEEFKDWAIKWLNKLNDREINDRSTIYTNQQNTRNKTQADLDYLPKCGLET